MLIVHAALRLGNVSSRKSLQAVRAAPPWKWYDDDVCASVVAHDPNARCDDAITKRALYELAFVLQQPHVPRPLHACIADRNLDKQQLEIESKKYSEKNGENNRITTAFHLQIFPLHNNEILSKIHYANVSWLEIVWLGEGKKWWFAFKESRSSANEMQTLINLHRKITAGGIIVVRRNEIAKEKFLLHGKFNEL